MVYNIKRLREKEECPLILRRVFSLCAALALMLALAVPGYAAQSRAANFLKTYEITGDGAADMVSVALSQLHRSGAGFDYTENWCADFVSDCARLAGQTKAVPFHNNVYGLRDQILQAGGVITTLIPQPGDICFMDWEADGNWDHVEIVYMVSGGGIYTVGGNTGSGTTPESRRVGKHAPIPRSQIAMILRPAYGGQTQPPAEFVAEEIEVDESYYEYNPVRIPARWANRPARAWDNLLEHTLN